MADELWTDLWTETTLHLPLTVTPTDDKTPSRVTTLQNEVTALTTIYADTKEDLKKHTKHGTTTVNTIRNIENQLPGQTIRQGSHRQTSSQGSPCVCKRQEN
jgi:hypothetical protein